MWDFIRDNFYEFRILNFVLVKAKNKSCKGKSSSHPFVFTH